MCRDDMVLLRSLQALVQYDMEAADLAVLTRLFTCGYFT